MGPDWNDPSLLTIGGDLRATNIGWAQAFSLAGTAAARLYGISPLLTVPVPEPSSVVLAALGFAGLALLRFRRCRLPVAVILLTCLSATAASAAFVPPGLQPGDHYHVVFVTSLTTVIDTSTQIPPAIPSWGGVAAADYLVTDSAAAAGLIQDWNHVDIIYKAVLSNSTEDARDHINVQGPVYNTRGELVATGATDLWDFSIGAPIMYDEQGVQIFSSFGVWTGTHSDGRWSAVSAGDNWNDPSEFASVGNLLHVDDSWMQNGSTPGFTAKRLYGISPLLTVPVPEPSSVVLAILGFAGLAVLRFRRQARLRSGA